MSKGWKGRHLVKGLVHASLEYLVRGSAVIWEIRASQTDPDGLS